MPLFQRSPIQRLKSLLGRHKVTDRPEDLALYGMDATTFRGKPRAVVFPENTGDVQNTVRITCDNTLALVARGAGSGLSGGSVPLDGELVVSFERMSRILDLDAKKLTALVEPGVVTAVLQEEAARHGLFYPPDPSSYTISTIGGNVAENAGGLRCFKYGITSHYVQGIEFVDADAQLVQTGVLDQTAAIPDLTPLLVGSEGTLGIFTRIALRLIPQPHTIVTLAAYLPSTDRAFALVNRIIVEKLTPSILEFIGQRALQASAAGSGVEYPPDTQAMLLIELDGSQDSVANEQHQLEAIFEETATSYEIASDAATRERLWQMRRNISPSLIRLSSGKIHEDIAVPRGSLSELGARIGDLERKYQLSIAVYGHAGDGNLHVVVPFELGDAESEKRANLAVEEVYRSAIDLGGTITGEHGIGIAKRKYLSWQASSEKIATWHRIKRHFDPRGIFNPGKLLPPL